jgi:predicted transcriptional regulator
MKKHLLVGIKGADESAQEFVEAWRRAARGQPVEPPIERLYFEDLATMLKVLTPRRLEMLKAIHQIGPVSVRALAGRMKRDYKNVHYDCQVLARAGLIMRSPDGRLRAPWSKIIAEIALAARAADTRYDDNPQSRDL